MSIKSSYEHISPNKRFWFVFHMRERRLSLGLGLICRTPMGKKPTPLIEPETPPCNQCRHNTTAGLSLFCTRRSLIRASSPPSFSPLPCTRSARFCLSCCPFFCWPRAGDISPRSAGAPSLRSSLLGWSWHWSAATRRTLCRCSSELLSASITRRTALRFGECFQPNSENKCRAEIVCNLWFLFDFKTLLRQCGAERRGRRGHVKPSQS